MIEFKYNKNGELEAYENGVKIGKMDQTPSWMFPNAFKKEEKETSIYNLDRFISAQKIAHETAKQELMNGKKESHYMWYIFPQHKDLGYSKRSKYYGLESIEEAKQYYKNDYLASNLNELLNILLNLETCDAYSIFGYIDYYKFQSSLTIFYLATNEDIFKKVLDKYYKGKLDDNTVKLLEDEINLMNK